MKAGEGMVSKRLDQLMAILIKQKKVLTVADYAELLGVSKRTIYSDLDKIKPLMEKKGYQIQTMPGQGIRVQKNTDVATYDNIDDGEEDYYPETRRFILLQRIIIEEIPCQIEDISDEFYVSVSSIRNDIDILNHRYVTSGAQLCVEKMHICIKGSEEQIQRLMLMASEDAVSQSMKLTEIYDDVIVKTCFDIIRSFEDIRKMEIPEHYFNHIVNIMVILTTRCMQNHHIQALQDALLLDKIMEQPNMLLAREILSFITKKITVEFTEADYHYFANYLIADRIQFPSTETIPETEIEIFYRIIHKMEELLNVNIFQYEDIVKNLLLHLHAMVFRLRTGINLQNELLEQTKKEFGSMFELTWFVLDSESEALHIKLSEDEVGFVMIHFQNIVDLEKKSKKVLLICPLGIASSQMVLNRIKNVLPPLDILEVASVEKALRINLESIDFIISTVEIEMRKPTIVVSALMGDMDIQNIRAFYQDIVFQKEKKRSVDKSILSHYLRAENILVGNETDKETVIHHMVTHLVEKGIVQKEYEATLLKREQQGATDNRYGVAIPHGNLNFVNKTTVSIWIGEKPIKWTNHSVHMAIFFNVNKQDLMSCKAILDEIYHLIKSEELAKLFETGITKKNFLECIDWEE